MSQKTRVEKRKKVAIGNLPGIVSKRILGLFPYFVLFFSLSACVFTTLTPFFFFFFFFLHYPLFPFSHGIGCVLRDISVPLIVVKLMFWGKMILTSWQ